MTLKRAIEILIEYNKWRVDAEITMQDPSLITVALDKVIADYLRKNK